MHVGRALLVSSMNGLNRVLAFIRGVKKVIRTPGKNRRSIPWWESIWTMA